MDRLKELREKQQGLAAKIQEFADRAGDTEKPWTSEDETNYQKCNADYDDVATRVAALARSADVAAAQVAPAGDRRLGREDFGRDAGSESHETPPVNDETRDLALRGWALCRTKHGITEAQRRACESVGLNHNSNEIEFSISSRSPRTEREARALSAVSGPAGAYTIQGETLRALEVALLAFGGMRQAAEVIRTETGAVLPYPTSDDTSNTGELIAENTEVSTQDVAFGVVNLQAYKYSSKMIKVPTELLQDSAINIGAFLGERIGERISRIQNTHFTTGNGAAKPNGIITAATSGVTAAAQAAITMDEVLSLIASVDPAYRPGSAFMARDATIISLRKLKDGVGRYLWNPGDPGTGTPDTLWGYPVITNQDVAALANAAKTLLFGQLSRYKIRDVQSMRILRLAERYAEYDQVAFIGFLRSDGNLIDAGTHPVKFITQA